MQRALSPRPKPPQVCKIFLSSCHLIPRYPTLFSITSQIAVEGIEFRGKISSGNWPAALIFLEG